MFLLGVRATFQINYRAEQPNRLRVRTRLNVMERVQNTCNVPDGRANHAAKIEVETRGQKSRLKLEGKNRG